MNLAPLSFQQVVFYNTLVIIFLINLDGDLFIEPAFFEVLNSSKTKVIVGCIYLYLHMDLDEFHDYYLRNLLGNLSEEIKTVLLLSDFNVGLLKYHNSPQIHSLTTLFFPVCSFSPVNLLHIFRATFLKDTSGRLLLRKKKK